MQKFLYDGKEIGAMRGGAANMVSRRRMKGRDWGESRKVDSASLETMNVNIIRVVKCKFFHN